MPWKKFPVGGGRYKVWKVDAQGNKVGKPLSKKPQTSEEADAQARALYATEGRKEAEPVAYTTDSSQDVTIADFAVTGTDADTIAAIITIPDDPTEFKEAKMMMDDEGGAMAMMPGPCSFEEMDAMEKAEETADQMRDMTYKFQMMAGNVMRHSMIEDKAAALVKLADEFANRIKKPADEKSNEAIAKQIVGDNQSEQASNPKSDTSTNQEQPGGDSDGNTTTNTHKDLFIWKEGDTYRWLVAYSNNRRDEDIPPEIISNESHKEFDAALHKGEWPMPEAYLWHVPYPVGITQYHAYDESTGFPVAAGIFYKGMEWAAEGIIQAGWDGVSHGMPSEWLQRDKDDPTVITRHRTKEISFLPLWAAANKLTFNVISKETIMADEKGLPAHKREEFVKAFGEEQVTKIEAALADKAKEADEAGIEKKEQEAPEAATPALTPDDPVVKALAMVVEQLTALETRLKAIEEKQTEEVKEQPFDLIEFLASKSAIGKPENKVDGRTALAKSTPEEMAQPSWTESAMGIRLSLVDQFVAANQEWQNRTGGTN